MTRISQRRKTRSPGTRGIGGIWAQVMGASGASQIPLASFKSGLLPFSPIVHASATAANSPFGMVEGQSYTFRYPGSATFANGDLCPGDQDDSPFLVVANKQALKERG